MLECVGKFFDRKTDNVEIVTLNAVYPKGSVALNGICSCLVIRLVGVEITLDIALVNGVEIHGGAFTRYDRLVL